MNVNPLTDVWNSGRAAVGTYVMYDREITTVQIAAAAGLDFIVFDMEHRPHDYETIHDMAQVARLAGIAPIVGPAEIAEYPISHVLDMGASGVIVPHVETPEEVMLAVNAARYPPRGRRGRAGTAGHNLYHAPESAVNELQHYDSDVSLFLKVEAEHAIHRIDELLAPEGVDGVMIGPLDLSINMGIPGQTTHPRLLKLVDRARGACLDRGLRFGDYVGRPDDVAAAVDAGASWVIVGSELDALSDAWRSAAASVRE